MEIIPNLPEENAPFEPKQAETVPVKAANWLLEHRQNTEKHEQKTSYEKPAEVAQSEYLEEPSEATETYFERRHEVLDSSQQSEVPESGMIPLAQVLANYPSRNGQPLSVATIKPAQSSHGVSLTKFLSSPAYARAIKFGLAAGLLTLLALTIVYR